MKFLEKLPVALSGICLSVLCNSPAQAQEIELPDAIDDGPAAMEGMAPMEGGIEITLDAEGEPEFNVAFAPDVLIAAPGGPGFGGPGFGGPGGPRMMMRRHSFRGGHGGCPMFGALDLSDDQYEKLYALKNSFLDKVGPKMLEIKTQSRHLKDVMTQPSVDVKAARNMQDKINNLRSDLANLKLDNRIAMMDVLTAEQRKKIRDFVIKGGRGMHHRGPHPMMKMEKKDS